MEDQEISKGKLTLKNFNTTWLAGKVLGAVKKATLRTAFLPKFEKTISRKNKQQEGE